MALKRANGEGNLRKRSNGTWEARITVGVDPATGKLISKSVYARTQKEVRAKVKALQAKLEGHDNPDGQRSPRALPSSPNRKPKKK